MEYLTDQSITADDPAVAIPLGVAAPTERQSRVRLVVTIDASAAAVDVSLANVGATAHGARRVLAGTIAEYEVDLPSGTLYPDGLGLFAASSQAVSVGVAWRDIA